MLSQTELEREQYESRLMAIRDEKARIKDAEDEGERRGMRKGFEQGNLAGRIQFIGSMLRRPETPSDELFALPLADLRKRAADLEREFRNRNNGAEQQN